MYRKYVAPLDKKSILNLMKHYASEAEQFALPDDFEFCLGQLYKLGIVQIKKQLEHEDFTVFISLTEAGKELLKQANFSTQAA
jgi:uncharacterized protein YgfB (UPF0149 family)